MRPLPRALLALVFAAASVSGCVHTVDPRPEAPVDLPAAFAHEAGSTDGPHRWWRAFGDPALDRLVDRALQGNLSLRGAWARLDAATAVREQAGSAYFPEISAGLGFSRTRQVFDGGPLGLLKFESSRYNASVQANYEVDLWGRVGHLMGAAQGEIEASRADVEAMAMTLAAQVTEIWFGLLEQRAQLALMNEQLHVGETFLELIGLRFKQSFASALDVYQQRQQIQSIRTQIPLARMRLEVLEHQLAVLVGVAPGALDREGEDLSAGRGIPDPPPLPSAGVPADLLQRRPDLRAARARVLAADHRVGVALADRFPRLSLQARTGYDGTSPENFFDSWVWGLAANLLGPIFDGGRRAAEVDRNRAMLRAALSGYGQTLLVSVREVEDALVQERRQREHLEGLRVQLRLARASLSEARSRYARGLGDYLPVLGALQAVQALERQEIGVRRQLLGYRVQLHRALGGTWAAEIARPESEGAGGERVSQREGEK